MEIPGRICNGAVVPGAAVTIVTPPQASECRSSMTSNETARLREALARLDAVDNENPGDRFSGANHDQALFGDQA